MLKTKKGEAGGQAATGAAKCQRNTKKSAPCGLVRPQASAMERLTKALEQGASSKTVRAYGKTMQRGHEDFVGRSYRNVRS
ncbi:hypothetical protein [Massilia haematophila]|jgi:hypothetical protein|uniref:Uncharacterized protein n=1 Tax=Massilia haematophila TaxID=457923 RepID=A0ABV7PHC2_9BURK